MSGRRELFGTYRPAGTWLHRMPVAVKGLSVLLLTLFLVLPMDRWLSDLLEVATGLGTGPGSDALLVPRWAIPLSCIAAIILAGATAGLTMRSWWNTLRPAAPVFVLLAAYHLLMGTPQRGAAVLLTVIAAMLATRVLLETTPQAALMDGLVRLLTPLKIVGLQPARVGLAIQIMLRAIPYLLGVLEDIRQAAAARGIRMGPVRVATPAVIAAVAHAQRTGEALAARGLD
ncbi:energy-coupling factor transporter transmembrane protein EcfT [Kocuria coralli]|uniref:Energy-coupling factor transporter transmembrane protein EcfT n=1 Tax=Kocuria coralli TaxID=1461025 RepID=A0A5J5KZ80_9MICC|nr:energy-coupling factor transporter transmembrane component T [Kocuria coralli]KAA9394969.1 energy-coupling factor transporter transmembrane protein EcfT [Kocuria coralli]